MTQQPNLVESLWHFIENEGTTEEFFELRERVRSQGDLHDVAPALLEALKNLWSVCDTNSYEVPMGYRNQVFSAIAKAAGES
jgi:hypothetical protein